MLQQNNPIEQLSIILQKALNPDPTIRQPAENQINEIPSQNFEQFLISLSKIISTEEEDKRVRQLSSTLIKNTINKPLYIEKWFQLSEDLKDLIKNNVLSALASGDIDIRKAAALTIAGICKIEIPKKKYINIFDILMTTSQNENINIQLSSVTTLEYIYEEINPGDIPNGIVAKLLNTYYSLLTKENINPQLAINTLLSVYKFLPFIKDFINDQSARIKFYDLLEKYVENDNEQIRKVGLQIFNEICRIYYDSLQDYIEKIINFTKVIIEKDIESNKLICLYIWCTIGNEENKRINENTLKKQCHNFLQRYNQILGDICIKYIVTEDYENEDEETISKACSELISYMSRCCQYNFLSNMINYIGANVNSPIEKIKYSALNVFRSIIYTIHKGPFYNIVKDSLNMISEILLNNNAPSYFKVLCASIIKAITKNYSEEFINDTIYFDKMIALYLQLFNISTKEVLYILIISLNNLCKKVRWDENDETNILSKHMQSLCEPLMKICKNYEYYNTEYNIIFVSFILIGTLGERSAKDVQNQMSNIFSELVNMFQKSLNKKNFPNEKICYIYQEYIASTLSGFLITGMADKNLAEILLGNIINSFEMRHDLYDEGILLIGAIALYTQKKFNNVMDIITPYLTQGLKSLDSSSICKSSIFCLSDIIRALENQNTYVKTYLPLILNILSDNNIDQALKPNCFNILSDIFVYCKNEAFNFFERIMNTIGGAMKATQISFNENSDSDTCIYFIGLREHIIETITCIFSAIKEVQNTKEFVPFVQPIINYINFIANDYACSINIFRDGLFLIGDFCDSYNVDIKQFLDINLIKTMFNKIENDKNEENDENIKIGIEWAKKTINKVL